MITSKDIGRQCFIKFKVSGNEHYTWENIGARIMGLAKQKGEEKVIVRMPDGSRVAVNIEDIRVLAPRPA